MDFEIVEVVPGSAERVRRTLCDHLEDLVPYLPSIESIDILVRDSPEPDKARVESLWQGSKDLLPALIRPFVSKQALMWRDVGDWDHARGAVDWTIKPTRFKNLYDCGGTHYIEEIDATTSRVRMSGAITVHPGQLKGIPKRWRKGLAPRVEAFIIKRIKPNLQQVPLALKQLLAVQDG